MSGGLAQIDAIESAARAGQAPKLSPAELAELIEAFAGVTARLEATHATLRAEVSRLNAELAEANDQLQRSRRLAALGEMAAGISHEVRNPLASIRLYARMLEEDLGDRPEQRDVAGKIAGAVTRLDAIVGDVLTFAREMRVRPERLDVATLLDEAVGVCRVGDVELDRTAVAGDLEVECDGGLCVQALVNLVRNAVEAMEGSGCLGLEAREATELDQGGAPRGWIVIGVRDSGPGIPPDVVERMFNPFFTTRATGTGLGLAIVHRILDAHGGRVEVRSEPGRGACVELWFPRRGAASPEGGVAESSVCDRGARTAAA